MRKLLRATLLAAGVVALANGTTATQAKEYVPHQQHLQHHHSVASFLASTKLPKQRLLVHLEDHAWASPRGKLSSLPLKDRLRAYRIIAAHSGWYKQHQPMIQKSKTVISDRTVEDFRYHIREFANANKHIAKIERALHPPVVYLIPHYNEWLCIHHYEGAWNDPNPPYFGGLQMDMEFMRSYGGALLASKGTADHWTPMEQMMVAERAYASGRGFWPWPNTARMCGLL